MQQQARLRILFSAGESSGDQHAANMFLEIKKMNPTIQGLGMGGNKMAQAGIDIRYNSAGIGVIGVVEVLKHYGEIRKAMGLLENIIVQERPDLLICVDYKEFNFKLARFAKQQGIKVLFYVGPQVWAWRSGRVKQYGAVIDMMAVIFPFEVPYYEAEKVPVRYVGHPSVDKVHPMFSREQALQQFNLNDNQPIIGLLPGSRQHEIKRLLPEMLKAAALLKQEYPECQFILPQADSIRDIQLQEYLQQTPCNVQCIKQLPYDVIQCCHALITCSGTATLEVALLNVPMVIIYKLSPVTYWLGRLLVKTPFIGLPNIIAGKRIVRELIQHEANAENMFLEIKQILSDANYQSSMRKDLLQVKQRLGQGGGSYQMARLALELLNS